MESQPRASSIVATRLWKVVRIAFVIIRKGLISKRNSIGGMINGARDRKLMRESPRSLSFNHYRHSRKRRLVGLNGYEYEFSCSNSPDQVIVPLAKNKTQFFPCMRLPKVIKDFVEDEPARVSNFSSDDEGDGKYEQVDHKAEEFIARFHGQLRKQIVH